MKLYYYSFILLFLISPIIFIGCSEQKCDLPPTVVDEYHYVVSGAGTVEVNGEYIQIDDRNNNSAFALATCPDLNTCDYTIEYYDDTYKWCIKFNASIFYYNTYSPDVWIQENGAPPVPTGELIVNHYLLPSYCN